MSASSTKSEAIEIRQIVLRQFNSDWDAASRWLHRSNSRLNGESPLAWVYAGRVPDLLSVIADHASDETFWRDPRPEATT